MTSWEKETLLREILERVVYLFEEYLDLATQFVKLEG